MAFQIGDEVKILDENADGVILDFVTVSVAVVELDGFPFEFPVTSLMKVDGDNNLIHRADERDFEHLMSTGTASKLKEVLMHIPVKVFDKVSRKGYPELDLHIHELVDKPKSMTNSEMIELQTHRLEQFIHSCIDQSVSEFVVIHGVGEGVLRTEIRKVLQSHGNIDFKDADFREYGAGATYARILGLYQG
jgi:hypothetical protein